MYLVNINCSPTTLNHGESNLKKKTTKNYKTENELINKHYLI
jgi:hypothetical protein